MVVTYCSYYCTITVRYWFHVIFSEMEVFMSAIRWLKHKWQDRQGDILDIMACVRFGNIAPWQLVDIKRNPENPDFLKLTSIPEICKMIDDGLAFVIFYLN